MRIDKYLKTARIIKRRAVAKEACDQGRVRINDLVVKASENVKVGDIVTLEYSHRIFKYRVLDLSEHVRKDEAGELYEIIGQGE
ncbi:MAG: hypothetical protein AVO33_03450 [delta proteobacterium ML8_F1]|nr:MAG: hypothetical protein AVO33_03450 [delta proteobacterium ML8_F1]